MSEERNIKININSNAKEVARDTNALGASIENATNSTAENNQEVAKGNESYKTFKTQLREANAELQKQIQLTGESSASTVKAAKAVADLKDQMGFAKDLSDQFNPDQKMKALGAATQIAGTGLQGVTAGMALFGGESADTQKQLLKVQAAMAFSDAISNLSNLGDQYKVFKTIVIDTYNKIIAKKAADKLATDAGTASQLKQNLAVLANPYVIAAAALAALTIGIYAWTKASSEATKQEEKTARAVKSNAKETDKLKESIESISNYTKTSNEIEVLRAKAYGATDDEIRKLIKSQKELSILTAGTDASTAYDNLVTANQNALKAVKTGNKDLIKEAEENQKTAQELYKKANEDYNTAIIDDVKFGLETQIEINNKSEEEAEKAKQKRNERVAKDKEERENQRKKDAEDYNNSLKEQAKNEADLKQKIIDAIDVAQEKNNEFRISAQEKEIQDVNDKYFTLIENAKKFGLDTTQLQEAQWNEQNDINLKYQEIDYENKKKKADEEIEIDKKVADAKKENQDRLISQGESLIANVKNLAGKNKAIQRAAIIADGGIALGKSVANTAEAVTKDLAKGAPFSAPLVALDIAVGATSAASIIKGTADSLRAVGSGGSISGGNTVSVPTIPQSIPQVAFNNTAENQIGKSIVSSTKEQPPVQVVLLESDVTKAQNNVKVLENKNIL